MAEGKIKNARPIIGTNVIVRGATQIRHPFKQKTCRWCNRKRPASLITQVQQMFAYTFHPGNGGVSVWS